MPIEIYRFPEGKKLSMEDVLRLMTNLTQTVSAIKTSEILQREHLSTGIYDVSPIEYSRRAYDYTLEVKDDGTGIVHVIPKLGREHYRDNQLSEHTEGDIDIPSMRENFTLVGQTESGDTALWAIVSYVK